MGVICMKEMFERIEEGANFRAFLFFKRKFVVVLFFFRKKNAIFKQLLKNEYFHITRNIM